ncbi:HRDC domain-containing protein, partial [Actinotalea sp. C106]|uniref:HRDC domain-containing protein n=1 Tax=Actinotalea sp. C106 TaxID=2908644 RepID=UPI002028DE94
GARASRKRTRSLEGLWPTGGRGRRSGAAGGAAVDLEDVDPALLEALHEWRRTVAVEADKPAWTIVVDAALETVARDRPTTIAELARVRGIGPAKLDRYGSSLLALVAEHPRPRP